MVDRTSQRTWLPLIILIIAMATILTLDLVIPLGVAIHILYFPLLMIAALCLSPRIAWTLFSVCAMLIVIGAVLSPSSATAKHIWLAMVMQLSSIPLAGVILWITLMVHRSQAELRAAFETLRQGERDFRTLAENLPDIIVRYDRQLRLVYFNKAVEGIAGIPPELFIGKTNAEIDMPDNLVRSSRREVT